MRARHPAVFGVEPSAQGGVLHRIRVISLIRVVWGRSVRRSVLLELDLRMPHARQPWHRSDHAGGARLFRGSDKPASLLPIALNIFRESRTAEWFRARDWGITRLTAEYSPDKGVSGKPGTAWELVRFFYDNLGVLIAYKVVGRDPAIGFRGAGINEARPISSAVHPRCAGAYFGLDAANGLI
jgi:hypothetical protein